MHWQVDQEQNKDKFASKMRRRYHVFFLLSLSLSLKKIQRIILNGKWTAINAFPVLTTLKVL